MAFKLRYYQSDAVSSVIEHIRRSLASALLVLPTGAGKSLVVSELARIIHQQSGKNVLCLAPSAELVQQNREKFESYGLPASMYSASAGRKDLRYPVVFGSPLTVANAIDDFRDYAAVIVDEAHGITPTLIGIIDTMKESNPRLRVIGMTATPYRRGEGYIYRSHVDGRIINEHNARDPYWDKVTYELKARELISNGFLTMPELALASESYSVSDLVMKGSTFTPESIAGVFNTDHDKTSRIVDNVLGYFYGGGYRACMFFAATREHADFICSLLPEGTWRAVYANTPKSERKKIIADYKAQAFPFVVNMNVLTTGFDAPHVDLIAILRATESPGLWQQIAGRGLRLFPGKDHCKILDYAGNIERFFSESGDIFEPEIIASKPSKGVYAEVHCPQCDGANTVRLNPDAIALPAGVKKIHELEGKPELIARVMDRHGYALDLAGDRLEVPIEERITHANGDVTSVTKMVPVPAHYARRCACLHEAPPFRELERCQFMWESKKCPQCGHVNDISARVCPKCNAKFIDPNKKLQDQAAVQDTTGPYDIKQANVIGMSHKISYAKNGNMCLIVNYETDHPLKKYNWLSDVYIPPQPDSKLANEKWKNLCKKSFETDVNLTIMDVISGWSGAKRPARIAWQQKQGEKYPKILYKTWEESR